MDERSLFQQIFDLASSQNKKIGIGNSGLNPLVKETLAELPGNIEVVQFGEEKGLVTALRNRQVDGAVRGDLDSKQTMREIKFQFKVDKIHRAALVRDPRGHEFFLGPVGVDEGATMGDKLELVISARSIFNRFGLDMKVGIVSGGRLTDRGRSRRVDSLLEEGELLEQELNKIGVDAKHYGILLEYAVNECNLIIAPDGISGNLIFRTLCLVGNGKCIGAPVLNIDKPFVDTSRSKSNYSGAVSLAVALSC